MKQLRLSMAMSRYDHVEDLVTGRVGVEGVSLNVLEHSVEEIFQRFTRWREWDVSEFSLALYAALRSRGDESLIAIPVFPSRVFRHSAIYVRRGGVDRPQELTGARVGVAEWAQTAGVWARSLISSEYGVDLRSIDWYQAGTSQPGRRDAVEVELPHGLRYTTRPNDSLDAMLNAGELDAVISARPPLSFGNGAGEIVRLFADYPVLERDWYRRTGIFPIMHVVVLRADVYESNPWIAANLFSAFEEARRCGVARLRDASASRIALPWASEHLAELETNSTNEWWAYGIDANRVTLEAFLEAAADQGVTRRRLQVEELFAPQVLHDHRV